MIVYLNKHLQGKTIKEVLPYVSDYGGGICRIVTEDGRSVAICATDLGFWLEGVVSPKEFLTRVRNRLTPEGAWVQRCEAQTASGEQVHSKSPHAAKWSLSGALVAEEEAAKRDLGCFTLGIYEKSLDALYSSIFSRDGQLLSEGACYELGLDGALDSWNDDPSRTQADILAAIDKAITLLPE